MSKELEQHTNELIVNICLDVTGIGQTKAFALAADFSGDLAEFLNADGTRLHAIKNSKLKSYLKDSEIEALLTVKELYKDYVDTREAWIFYIGRKFLNTAVDRLQEFNLDNMEINPFLAIALDLKDPEQVLKFNLYQSITRSVVTIWGNVVEELLARCGADRFLDKDGGRSGRRPDVMKIVNDKEHYIQVKSGPNTMNVDMVQSLNEVIASYGRTKPTAKVMLGMTYGTKAMISSQIRSNLNNFDDSVLIGRDLWDFISEKENYHQKIFEILDAASKGILEEPFTELMNQKLRELVGEWEERYRGKSLLEVLDIFM